MASGFNDLLEDLLAPLGGVSLRRLFGGIGVFKEAIMFGLVADDVLYLKADDETSGRFAAEDCGPFIYDGRGKAVAMPYWRLPDRLLDEPDEFAAWARIAFDVAVRTAKPKRATRTKQKPARRRS